MGLSESRTPSHSALLHIFSHLCAQVMIYGPGKQFFPLTFSGCRQLGERDVGSAPDTPVQPGSE